MPQRIRSLGVVAMRITTLGTGHGLSEKNRYCSSTMVEIGDRRYLIDAGAPMDYLFVCNGWRMSDVRGVFLTHMHADHVALLPPLVENLTCLSGYLKKREGVATLPPCSIVFPTAAGRRGFTEWLHVLGNPLTDDPEHPFAKGEQLALTVASVGEVYRDGDVSVRALRTAHMKDCSPSYAYVMEAEGKRVLFTGDVAKDVHDLADIFARERFDAVVCELTHFQPDAALGILRSAKTDLMVFNHICGYEGEREAWVEAHRADFPFTAVAATDGQAFEI